MLLVYTADILLNYKSHVYFFDKTTLTALRFHVFKVKVMTKFQIAVHNIRMHNIIYKGMVQM